MQKNRIINKIQEVENLKKTIEKLINQLELNKGVYVNDYLKQLKWLLYEVNEELKTELKK